MKSKTSLLLAFLLVALVQLYVPADMILDREKILASGTEYKFKTAPLDPNDPFRGKYIVLSFRQNSIALPDRKPWENTEDIYVNLKTDRNGFAQVAGISKTEPASEKAYLKAQVDYITTEHGKHQLFIRYPFDRFYQEETVASEAEKAYFESVQDTTKTTYAVVQILKGEAVLKDVYIEDTPISKLVKAGRKRK
jgi:uncharacterized membrane-anchored protein